MEPCNWSDNRSVVHTCMRLIFRAWHPMQDRRGAHVRACMHAEAATHQKFRSNTRYPYIQAPMIFPLPSVEASQSGPCPSGATCVTRLTYMDAMHMCCVSCKNGERDRSHIRHGPDVLLRTWSWRSTPKSQFIYEKLKIACSHGRIAWAEIMYFTLHMTRGARTR